MATIVTRSGKGSPLTNNEVDANFTNLNNDKLESGDTAGSLTITTVDINGGTIDGATIATSDVTVGAGKTLDVSAGTLTLANDQISGDKIEGGTIGSVTITTADINGGTLDGVTIGGSSAGAGSFTTLTASGDVNFDSGTLFVDASADAVGIGTSSPGTKLEIYSSATQRVQINQTPNYTPSDYSALGGSIGFSRTFDNRADLNTVYSYRSSSLLDNLAITSRNEIAFMADDAEAMRIDSSGRLLVGTSTSVGSEQVLIASSSAGSQTQQLNLKDTNASANGNFFLVARKSDDNYVGGLRRSGTDTAMAVDGVSHLAFQINGTEVSRFDSSGKLLVGKTSSSFSSEGSELRSDGQIIGTKNGGRILVLNRLTSDGNLAEFYKDNTTVGSIGADSGDLYIGTGDTGVRFRDAGDDILPFNESTGADRDAAIDLGDASARFKDLYLSGAVLANNNATDLVGNGIIKTKSANGNFGASPEIEFAASDFGFDGTGRGVVIVGYFYATNRALNYAQGSRQMWYVHGELGNAGTALSITNVVDVTQNIGGGTNLQVDIAHDSANEKITFNLVWQYGGGGSGSVTFVGIATDAFS